MAFIFANGALEARPVFVGASAQQPTANRIYDVGSHDFIESLDANFNGVVKVGTSIFINAAVNAERAQVSGTAERAIFGSGDLYAGPATTAGVADQIVYGDGALEASPATTDAQVKLYREAFGSAQAGVFRTQGSGIVARRLLLASGELTTGQASVSGDGQRGSNAQGELQALHATVEAETNLDRLVKWVGVGDARAERATVNAVAVRVITGEGACQAGRATVLGFDFVRSSTDSPSVLFYVEPRPELKTGVRGSLIVQTALIYRLSRLSYSWTINPEEKIEPMIEGSKTAETETIRYELPPRERRLNVEPAQANVVAFTPTDYEIEPINITYNPEVKAA